ncbi:MAG TPA: heavy-metal-associated domain-containing protein [Burkholderiales bacterium]|jgi:copper chaperone|nr:heavy-metal-associated domain-containing protein [Burkholderiales bacterium]
MIELQVQDMTCGHCVGRVTKAVKAVDEAATVDVNLENKRVSITSSHGAVEFAEAIREAGYTAQPA